MFLAAQTRFITIILTIRIIKLPRIHVSQFPVCLFLELAFSCKSSRGLPPTSAKLCPFRDGSSADDTVQDQVETSTPHSVVYILFYSIYFIGNLFLQAKFAVANCLSRMYL